MRSTSDRQALVEAIRAAGVVGAGGAGFPTHVKASAEAEVVVVNAAECEPLLHKDGALLEHHAGRVLDGLRLMMAATGAGRGIVGVKAKNAAAVAAVREVLPADVEMALLGDYYPAGDEFALVYDTTGRLIPTGGLPIHVGVVVCNVETLANVAAAHAGEPVTRKWLTVAGAVAVPTTLAVPLGVTYREVLDACGGVTAKEPALFVGGVMMGPLERDLDAPVTKTTTGLVVLPGDHALVRRRSLPERLQRRIGHSACDQCSYCTEMCPRYLLGHPVEPHRVMRGLGFAGAEGKLHSRWALPCCACGLCTLYACPEGLFPKEACDRAKHDLAEQGVRAGTGGPGPRVHPMREGRRAPIQRLVRRLGLADYDLPAPVREVALRPARVRLPLKQHVGAPAVPVIREGERVRLGQLVAEPPAGQLGARIHAPIAGRATCSEGEITIQEVPWPQGTQSVS